MFTTVRSRSRRWPISKASTLSRSSDRWQTRPWEIVNLGQSMGISIAPVRGPLNGRSANKGPNTSLARRSASHIGGPITFSVKGRHAIHSRMAPTLIGYARCSTDKQDLAAQKHALLNLGVAAERIYTDHGFTGTNRARPGLDQALAATRKGDTLVVPKLDRLARSVPDARAIGDNLAANGVKLQIGASVHDPNDPMGKLFFNILATFAEFEADLIRMRTREGMAIARAKGKLKGRRPKLSTRQQQELRRMYDTGYYSVSDLAELFSISRPTVYRTLDRQTSTGRSPIADS